MSNRDSPCLDNKANDEFIWERSLPADPQAVPEVRRAAIRACQDAGASEDECFTLDMALGEALANAVVHGVPNTPELETRPTVCLRIWCYRGQMIIEVRDHGPGFEPPPPPYPMPSDYEVTHGRGLPLMEKLTDALLISRGDADSGGVATYLVKKLSQFDDNCDN